MASHSITELIERKRDGGELSADELRWIIAQYTADRLPDYQMSSLLMAIFFCGMSQTELAVWTEAMLYSGEVLDFDHLSAPKVDKHSTGGVGDKVSIPLAPMVATCGIAVPMMSGRGLGHTGGTLDKLESIPGFTTMLDPDEFLRVLEKHHLVLAGQSETLVPADRRIYALRDATGTVPSVPLISSSIMSKKLAEGLDALVLDVKVGTGAFMKDEASARLLAETMVGIGASHDTPVVALLTDMNQPLGKEIGNANEIAESLDVLQGSGPDDLVEITYLLGVEMLIAGGVTTDRGEARQRLERAVASGAALDKFAEVIAEQGGNANVVLNRSLLPAAAERHEVVAAKDGVVTRCDALDLGLASVRLGGGRQKKEDNVDPAVGITLHAKVGAVVAAGDVLGTVTYNDEGRLASALPYVERAWEIGDETPPAQPLIVGEVRP
ncbi:MAG TPA: thymidine phosphorylase [Acidimicrobiia bacterium]|jgi:pyrimidine-nucleoside phosphorylase|nr:thymidine phosphorylase [Acidimicrobiia bacterium]